MSYTCPVCWRTSYHPDDEKYSYCGNCRDFTGGYGYGNERHRSSSAPAGQERKMRMPTNDEDRKAQPEVSQMQGERDCPSLQQLRRERMERGEEPLVRTVQRIGVYNDRMITSYENMLRLTKAQRWLIASVGLTFGMAFTNLLHIFTTPLIAVLITTGIIIFIGTCQVVYAYRGMKRLTAQKQEMDAKTESFKQRTEFTD